MRVAREAQTLSVSKQDTGLNQGYLCPCRPLHSAAATFAGASKGGTTPAVLHSSNSSKPKSWCFCSLTKGIDCPNVFIV